MAERGTKAARSLDGLYREHAGEVYRYAYAVLGNRSDAEDVTQTTFVNALRALERGERPRKPSNWLITIAHNIVRQRFRQQQARPTEVELDGALGVEEPVETGAHSLQELVRGLQQIPDTQREALVLREFEGRSYKEIQEILELSQGAVETLLFRARRSLAEELEALVTCEASEIGLSKRVDGRLTRKERNQLDAHIRGCPRCARLEASQAKSRRALKGLALLPLPLSLTLFKGAPSASAATGLSTIGVGGAAVAGGVSTGGVGGGLVATGVVAKAAAVVVAVSLAGGVSYVGVKKVHEHGAPKRPAAGAGKHSPATAKRQGLAKARGQAKSAGGKAVAKGHAAAKPATGRGMEKSASWRITELLAASASPPRATQRSTTRATRPRSTPREPVWHVRGNPRGRHEPALARG